MKNPVLDDIMQYATKKLTEAYGYCGQASGDEMAMLNSDDHNGRDFVITIKDEES